MKPHAKNYLTHFDLGEQDFIYCEYHYIKYGAFIRAVDLHHIVYRSQGGTDDINNIVALCRDCHNLAHAEQIDRCELLEIHKEFLQQNP
jgi:hypothetical protein